MLNSLTTRERYIAIGVVAAALVFLLNHFVLVPYTDARSLYGIERDKIDAQLRDAESIKKNQTDLTPQWTKIKSNGLKTDRGQAESQAQQAVLDWAKAAGVSVESLKPERDVQQNQFQIISFHVTGNGSMLSLSKLLWAIESATIPVRLNDLQITPRKEGTDELKMQISVSTLALIPDTAKPAGNDRSVTR